MKIKLDKESKRYVEDKAKKWLDELDKPLTVDMLLKMYESRFEMLYKQLMFTFLNQELNKDKIKELKIRIDENLYTINTIDYNKFEELKEKYIKLCLRRI